MHTAATSKGNALGTILKVVLIYDDFVFAARAAALLKRVAIRTDAIRRWEIGLWDLEALRRSAVADRALAEAVHADVILFAWGETASPPVEVMDWLDNWGVNRRVEDAAVMVLGPGAGACSLAGEQLERFAEQRGLTFPGNYKALNDKEAMPVLRWPARKRPVTRGWPRSGRRSTVPPCLSFGE